MTPIKHCLECGYDLTGLPLNRCPECGREFDPEQLAKGFPHPAIARLDSSRFSSALMAVWAVALSPLAVTHSINADNRPNQRVPSIFLWAIVAWHLAVILVTRFVGMTIGIAIGVWSRSWRLTVVYWVDVILDSFFFIAVWFGLSLIGATLIASSMNPPPRRESRASLALIAFASAVFVETLRELAFHTLSFLPFQPSTSIWSFCTLISFAIFGSVLAVMAVSVAPRRKYYWGAAVFLITLIACPASEWALHQLNRLVFPLIFRMLGSRT